MRLKRSENGSKGARGLGSHELITRCVISLMTLCALGCAQTFLLLLILKVLYASYLLPLGKIDYPSTPSNERIATTPRRRTKKLLPLDAACPASITHMMNPKTLCIVHVLSFWVFEVTPFELRQKQYLGELEQFKAVHDGYCL